MIDVPTNADPRSGAMRPVYGNPIVHTGPSNEGNHADWATVRLDWEREYRDREERKVASGLPDLLAPAPVELEKGNCVGSAEPDLWHSDNTKDRALAKQICSSCPVREACLKFALENNIEYGIYGGETARARVALRRALGLVAPRAERASPVPGVTWHARRGGWQVRVKLKRAVYHGGYFDDQAEAEQACRELRERIAA